MPATMRQADRGGVGCPRALAALAVLAWLVAGASTSSDLVCASKEGWPRYERHGRSPAKAKLPYCSRWASKTCCDAEQAKQARANFATLSMATASSDCRQAWQLLQCAICSPDVGVMNATAAGAGDPAVADARVPVCASFCEAVYQACITSYFVGDESYAIRGCNPSTDAVCSRLVDWDVDSAGLCELAGFRSVVAPKVAPRDDDGDDYDDDGEDDEDDEEGAAAGAVAPVAGPHDAMACYGGEEASVFFAKTKRGKSSRAGTKTSDGSLGDAESADASEGDGIGAFAHLYGLAVALALGAWGARALGRLYARHQRRHGHRRTNDAFLKRIQAMQADEKRAKAAKKR